MQRVGAIVAGLCVVLSASSAHAHPAPFSYLDVVFTDQGIEGSLVVHMIDIAHDLGITPVDRLLDDALVQAERQRIFDLVTPRLVLRGGGALTPRWQSVEVLKEDTALRLRYRISGMPSGAPPGALTIDTDLFPYDPIHQTFVNIYEQGTAGKPAQDTPALRQQMIFSSSTAEHTYYRGTTQGAIEVIKTFVPSGIHHILIGPDHILFLVGLLLLGGTWGALIRIVTAFTIGHSITLSLAALNLVTPPATIIEPAIALSIVFVGADNLVRGDGRDLRAWVALVFGLVHGFGFANVLREFGLPSEALGWSLFSFNVGVEIGQLAVVLLVTGALTLVQRRSESLARQVAFAGSLVVIAAGSYWFIQRVFFPA
jgi:hydrogenase/urease accessory protein HupE